MSEINCHGEELYYGEFLPNWHLVKLVDVKTPYTLPNGSVMTEGSWGITHSGWNDPSFCLSAEPMPDFDDEEEITEEYDKLYFDSLAKWFSDFSRCSPMEGYELVNSCIQEGYNPKNGGFVCWLIDKIYWHLQNYKSCFIDL